MFNIYDYIERAIMVEREFLRDRQYVVRDGEVVIVDEFTGRLAEGRKWRDGIHQAVEAKEGVEVTVETGQAARITVQDFFLLYEQLAGMTGTAMTSAGELRKIYSATSCRFPPTGRPSASGCRDTVFGTAAPNGKPWSRKCASCTPGPAGADRHPLDRQIGVALRNCCGRGASNTRCSTPTTSPTRPRSWPRPANWAG